MSAPFFSRTTHQVVGKIMEAHGLRGEVYMIWFTEDDSWIEKAQILDLVSPPSHKDFQENSTEKKEDLLPIESFEILQKKVHHKGGRKGLIVKLKGIDHRNQSEVLKKRWVVLLREGESSKEKGGHWDDLVGFKVVDRQRGPLGEVKAWGGHRLQKLLVVEGELGEIMVPFVEELVPEISSETQTLVTDLPWGLVPGEEV